LSDTPFGPTTSSTSASINSAKTPRPTPTLSASSPSFAAPTSSPSASSTRTGNTAPETSPTGASDTVSFFTAVPPSILDGSPRTLPAEADEAGGTAVKFYELRDNLPRPRPRAQATATYLAE
jgi:hypothetical protein